MSRFLLDTDHYTLFEFGHPPLLGRLLAHPAAEIAISEITIEEALKGRLAAISRAMDQDSRIKAYQRLAHSVANIATLNFVSYDQQADGIFQSLQSSKLRVGSQDLRIAAVALAHSMILVTRNRRDFGRVPGLLIEDWSGG